MTEEARNIFKRYRDELYERQRLNSSNFDKAILTLSSAGLGASFSFISNIIPLKEAVCIIFLKFSWLLFGLAIIVTILSFVTSQKAIDKQIAYAEKYYLDKKDEYLNKKSFWAITTDVLNGFSGLFFLMAVVFTLLFLLSNT